MTSRRGEVVLVLFPDSNLRTAKRRPALVVQAENLGTGLAQTVVTLVTSNLARGGHPSRIPLTADGEVRQRAGLLGHASIRTTADIYSHMIHGQDDEAARRWDERQKRNRPVASEKGQVQ